MTLRIMKTKPTYSNQYRIDGDYSPSEKRRKSIEFTEQLREHETKTVRVEFGDVVTKMDEIGHLGGLSATKEGWGDMSINSTKP